MAIINLRDYYPFYTSDCFMEVPEDVVEMFKEFDRKEAAYRLRIPAKAYYSWIGMMELSMRRFSLRSLPMNCMSVK